MIDEKIYENLFPDYRFQSVVYLLSPDLDNPDKVLYLHKNKPKEPTHQKLIGWGGNFEKDDNAFSCSLRELEEEIERSFDINLGLNLEDLVLQGVLVRHDLRRIIYIIKAPLNIQVPEEEVFNEGKAIYKTIDFHLKQENKKHFLSNDLEFLDNLFFSKKYFETTVNKDKSIKHYIVEK
jgi:hypothetical protein